MTTRGNSWGARMCRAGLCLAPALMPACAAPALAASVTDGSAVLAPLTAIAAATVSVLAFFALRRLRTGGQTLRQQMAELESRLNDAEMALAAERHVMLVWRGREEVPERLVDTLKGEVALPEAAADFILFRNWLDPESATALKAAMAALRQSGHGFNLAVRMAGGTLLEATGRAAGGSAILSFRSLAGERQQSAELAHESRKLARQVERLSAVLDAAPFPVWIRSDEGKLAWVNRAYVQSAEMTSSDQVLKAGFELAPTARIDFTRANPQAHLLGRAHTVLAGSMRALNIHEVPLHGGHAGYAIDVTPLEEAEKELDRHIKAHASTLNKLDTAIAIFGADQRLRFFNAAFVRLWSLDEKWLESKPRDGEILDRLRASRQLPEQANYSEWRTRQLSSYTTLEMRENYWYLPDGRSLHVVCEQHPFGGVTYLYENLTKEIQLESRYNELISVQRETLDNLVEAIALFGSDGRLKLFNPAFATFWKLDAATLVQEPHVDEVTRHPGLEGEAQSLWQDIRFAITGLEANRKPMTGRIMQGERILNYSAVPLADGNMLLSFTDISDPAKMEQALRDRAEALEAADRLKNTFLANVSYEIRTPLTSIVGFAETLDMGLVGELSAKQHEYVMDIRRSSEDLKNIIDAIIDLSAIDAGAMELHLEPVDVEARLRAVASRHAALAQRRGVTVAIEVAADTSPLVADAVRLEQMLGHLLTNAIGFSEQGSTIRMGARRSGDVVQIWVADRGRGMDAEFQKRAFERFQSRPLPGSHHGPGLGLALVKSFTELHGGKVSLVSKLHQGTTVVCNLPAQGPKRGVSPASARRVA